MTLEVKNGCFGYGSTQILKGIELSAKEGEVVAVLGPNGAGKTTLLRCIMGFLKWQSGDSLLDGESIRSMPQRKLWRKMAYVPQARQFTSSATVRETVLLGRTSHTGAFSQPTDEDVKKADEVMQRLNISHLADKSCKRLSGGELQMVLIARALTAKPQILILDEPESNLDFRNQLIVLDTITELAHGGMTCIFNTHYPAHALQRADKALILSHGGECIFGDASRVVTEQNIERCFGVKTVIGELETKENVFRSIMPVALSEKSDTSDSQSEIAIVSVIANSSSQADKINEILHKYSEYLIGRMGMPYRKRGLNIINITLEAQEVEISALVGELTLLDGVSVKATYAKKG